MNRLKTFLLAFAAHLVFRNRRVRGVLYEALTEVPFGQALRAVRSVGFVVDCH